MSKEEGMLINLSWMTSGDLLLIRCFFYIFDSFLYH